MPETVVKSLIDPPPAVVINELVVDSESVTSDMFIG